MMSARKALRPAIVIVVLLLAANAVFYAMMIRPRMQAYQDLEGAKTEFTREFTTAERTQKVLADFYDKLNATESNTESFYKKVLGTKQERLIQIQQEINDIGAEFRINPETVSYSNTDKDEDGLELFSIQLPVEGDYSDLRNFISRIESSKSFLIVDSISLQGTKEGGLQLQLNINVTTYFDAPWLKELKKTPARPVGKRG